MTIDEPTLMTVLGIASITSSGILFTLALFARQMPGIRLWSLGCLAVGLATVIDGPRLITDWRVASLLFNIPFSVGQAFMLAGTLQFCARPRARESLVLLSVLGVVITITFTYLVPDTTWRIGTLSLYQTIINLWTAWVLFKHPDRFSPGVFRVAAVLAVIQACSAFTQGAMIILSSGTFSYASPELPIANIASWVGVLLSSLVGNAVLSLLIMLRLVAELRMAADRDILTGLLNRRGLRPRIDAMMERHGATSSFAVLLLDIDHFKLVNDTHGHDTGDSVIRAIGSVLLGIETDAVKACRWGGEEFCVIAEGATPEQLVRLGERVREQFHEASKQVAGLDQGCTVSIGVALTTAGEPLDVARVFAAADAQLYRAKRAGRNRLELDVMTHKAAALFETA